MLDKLMVLLPQELMVENASLRESLYCVQKQLISLLSDQEPVFHQDLVLINSYCIVQNYDLSFVQNMEHNAAVIDVEHTCSRADEALLSGGHFQMPYDIVRDGENFSVLKKLLENLICIGMEENFKEKCKLVKDIMDDLRTRIKLLEKNQASKLPILALQITFVLEMIVYHQYYYVVIYYSGDCEQGPESSTEQVECCSGLVVGNYKDYVPKVCDFVLRLLDKTKF